MADTWGDVPLRIAALNGYKVVAELLLERGADKLNPNDLSNDYITVSKDMAQLVLDAGAIQKYRVKQKRRR